VGLPTNSRAGVHAAGDDPADLRGDRAVVQDRVVGAVRGEDVGRLTCGWIPWLG